MTLATGTKLGPYEILSSLGAGGMGEVYRAKDTTLGREIAIKILPADVASSPERLQRFEREAKTVATLNHPNTVTIGVQRRTCSSESQFGFEISQRVAKMAASVAANGKSRPNAL